MNEHQDLLLSLEDAERAMLNLIPKDPTKPMSAIIEYRKINKLEQRYVYETILVIGCGFVLVFLFGIFLYKAMSSNLSYE
jgi:hypothetical protein